MSEKVNDGGPAFPTGETNPTRWANYPGMTLRDYFAAAALPRCIEESIDAASTAEYCYRIADAMIAERAKG
jgi:hypothetical protein